MRTPVLAHGGIHKSLKCLLLLVILFCIIIVPVCAQPGTTLFWNYAFNSGGVETGGDYGGIDYSHYNVSTQKMDHIAPNTTPWEIWFASGILALILFLYSLRPITSMDELETSIIIAAMASVASGYCAYASFAIERLSGYGVTSQLVNSTTIPPGGSINNHEYVYMEQHLIYSEPAIGMLMAVFFIAIVAVTFYRISSHRALLGAQNGEVDNE